MNSDPNPLISTVPRPHPARLTAGSYPVHHAIPARFGDMDVNGHLNNVALETMHEDTRATFNRQLFHRLYSRNLRIVTSTIIVHYLKEAPWPATLQAAVGIGHACRPHLVCRLDRAFPRRCMHQPL
ncbi:MAG: hypothetical protein AB7G47_10955 [Mycolicibacterium sp.]|uniref:thioesterase family protein n=1 Tax=Mycolicibacterium sp. TaxID=2320850 RepID=UPI003D1387E5